MEEIYDLKLSIERLNGAINTLTAEFKAGDRNGEAGVRLLAQQVSSHSEQIAAHREDLKDALTAFNERTEQIRDASQHAASVVRGQLEQSIRDHVEDDSPHNKSLGKRLEELEKRQDRQDGALLVLKVGGGILATTVSGLIVTVIGALLTH